MTHTTRRELLTGAGALGLTAVLPAWAAKAAPAADIAAQGLLSAMAEDLLSDSPEYALSLGIDKGDRAALHSRFMDRSIAGDRARAARCTARLGQLRRLGRTGLSPSVALDLDTAETAYALAEEGWRTMPVGANTVLDANVSYRSTPYIVTQLGGAYSDLPDLLENKHDVASAADADAYLSRLESYAAAVDGETGRMRADAGKGAIPPVLVIDITAGQLKGIRATPVADWAIVKRALLQKS